MLQQKKHTILLVDDDKLIRDLVHQVLTRFGFNCLTVPNGLKLVRYLKLNRPDLLLLDVSMSWIDGFQLCRIVRKLPEYLNLPIIFLSGRCAPEDIAYGMKCGAIDYITKPFDILNLVRTIHKHLHVQELPALNQS